MKNKPKTYIFQFTALFAIVLVTTVCNSLVPTEVAPQTDSPIPEPTATSPQLTQMPISTQTPLPLEPLTQTLMPTGTPAPTARPLVDPPSAAFPYGVDRENALFMASGEPRTLDPAKWIFGADSIIGDLYSGVVQLDTSLRPIPDLAERWEVSPDGMVYTFYLRQGVTYHDGRLFDAYDVKYSWERALSPETESDTALTYLGDIVGVAEVASGAAMEITGVRVIDDLTLEVTLDAPKAYFLSKLSYPASWIVDRETIDVIEETPNGTGPFMLVEYEEGEVIVLARNPRYHRGYVALEYIVYLINPGPSVRLYEAGEIDLIGIYPDLLERANDPSDPLFGTVFPVNSLCTSIIRFTVTQPPFEDLLVRKAFVQAIDLERYNEIVLEGEGVIARGLFPPGLPGYNPDTIPIGYDPDEARQSLSDSSYGGPEGLPEIVFTLSGSGSGISRGAALLIQMWEEVLGVTVSVEQINSESYFDEIYAGNHGQLISGGWCADYPDPENFADILFHSGTRQNLGNYSNPEVDALLDQARVELDVETRLALYRQIEQMLIDDAAGVFTLHSRAYYVVLKPYVMGYVPAPIGVANTMNLSIERDQ
ncbi:MAG: peptide ABC transporter substrate-binding protein [Chloroflexi bacterium]|nr:peptide ABC transporter substrate-binding protein [Chloroflexota bacterium]